MSIVIHKYGGTSLATPDLILKNARRVADCASAGSKMVVIVSAMGDATDDLHALAHKISISPQPRELDMLISVGERITMSLFAMALHDLGFDAISFTGSQSGIITDTRHCNAHILEIKAFRIREALNQGKIVIVAGFQGVSREKEVTTLGRGGSDLTAVALAAYLGAIKCDIFTDVEGVYTANPRRVKSARKLSRITTEEMLELANLGAKVMYSRAMLLAERYNIPIQIRSSFTEDEGTIISQIQSEGKMEESVVHAIAQQDNQVMITIKGIGDLHELALLFESLSQNDINIDIIIQNCKSNDLIDISFTIADDSVNKAREVLLNLFREEQINIRRNLTKISIVGLGMASSPGIAARLYKALSSVNIPISSITTTEIKISVLVEEKDAQLAIELFHREFELDKIDREEGFPRIDKEC